MASKETFPIASSSSPSGNTLSSYSSSAMAFLVSASEYGKSVLSRQRPWSEALDRTCFNTPESVSDASIRIQKNLGYFRVNYAVLTSLVLIFGLIWHPGVFLILIALLFAWIFLYFARSEPLVIFNRLCTEREILFFLGLVTFIVVFFTSTGSTIFMGLAMAFALVFAHACFRNPNDLFLEEQTNVSSDGTNYRVSVQPPQTSVFNKVWLGFYRYHCLQYCIFCLHIHYYSIVIDVIEKGAYHKLSLMM